MCFESALAMPTTATAATGVAVTARGLRKAYGDFEAVAGVDFDVLTGQIFGFLGPNGAGKSSVMRMIGATSPLSGGALRVLGMDPGDDASAVRAMLGVCPQDDTLDPDLTVRQNLVIYGRFFGVPRRECRARADDLLLKAGLSERADRTIGELSGGMRRRLTIARSLMSHPSLLLLDEPTTGLDPQARHTVWEQLESLKSMGVTQILTTHYMDEAEQLCDQILIMDRGSVVASGSPEELICEFASPEIAELRFSPGSLQQEHTWLVRALTDNGEPFEILSNKVLLHSADGEGALSGLRRRGFRPATALVRRSNLEDVFIRLTGRMLAD